MLTDLKVNLTKELNTELKQYCSSVSAGSSDKKLKLLGFLEAIGLPAQTIGSLNKGKSQAKILLTQQELKKCQMLLIELAIDLENKKDDL